jgi:hypothetical protein
MNDVISTDLKENPRRFWTAIKSKKQEATGVAPLKNKEGFIHSDTTSKAEILKFLYLFQSGGLDVLLALLKVLNFLRVAFLMFPSTQG